jgi:hypothetical protein
MKHSTKTILGMSLECWEHKSCTAKVAEGYDWATIYLIQSKEEGKGHATELLSHMIAYYERQGKILGSSVALNEKMSYLLKKLNIKEYA